MFTFPQRLKIASSWLLSLLRGSPEPEHYPVAVRKQMDVPAESTWVAYVLNWPGPCGLGATESEARSALMQNVKKIAATRWTTGQRMPRPGTGLPIEFASADRVDKNPALLDDFIVRALGFRRNDAVFISDMSALEDFGEGQEVAAIKERIKSHYGLELQPTESTLIADILLRIDTR